MVLAVVVGLGCNPHPVEFEESDAGTPTVESVENRDRVVVPWVRRVGTDLLEDAVVSQRKIVFRGEEAAKRAKQFRRLDIIASEDPNHPMLRRVREVRERGSEHVVVETKPASVTDALYKGEFSTRTNNSSGEMRTTEQGLGTFSLFPDGTTVTYDGIGIGDATVGGDATPEGSIDPEFHLSFDIDGSLFNGNKRPDGWVYQGVRSCSSDSDCHDGEHCSDGRCAYHATGGDWSTVFDGTPYDDEQHTCQEMTTILEVMRQQEECRRTWRRYWANEARGDASEAACAYYRQKPRSGPDPVKAGEIPAPALAQVEWAKRTCTGQVKSFELDVSLQAEASLNDVEVRGQGAGWTDVFGNIDQKFRISHETGPSVTMIGWLPVIYNFTFEVGLSHWVGVDGDGRVTFEQPIGMEAPLEVNGGMHYYATAKAKEEGRFSDHDGAPGNWHAHGALETPEFHSLETRGEGDLSVGLTLTPEMQFSLLLYETAGPYVRFRAPKMKAETGGGVRTGNRGASGGKCTLGAQAGVQAQVGIATRNPLCSGDDCAGPSFNQSLWESCSNTTYCESSGRFCLQQCFANDCSSSQREICSDGEDNDGDGDVDCDDADCPVSSNEMACDGEDNDCDGRTDEGLEKQTCYRDGDLDGYGGERAGESCGRCSGGTVLNEDDCDDADASIHPGVTETCNGIDDNCDGSVDEGTDKNTCYRDADGDDYGDWKSRDYCRSCSRVGGYVGRDGDCDDGDPSINPMATEQCNHVDDNCDGRQKTDCMVPCNYKGVTKGVCGDAQKKQGASNCPKPSDYESPEDTCGDGKDNDCDGTTDEASSRNTCYRDGDGDGYGGQKAGDYCRKCFRVGGVVDNDNDCNDSDASVYPGTRCQKYNGCIAACQDDGRCQCI